MDFLGVEALTTMQEALKLIEQRTGEKINLHKLVFDDDKVFELMRNTNTLGVFQVGTNVGKAMCKLVQPENFGELVDIIALGRPGPMKSGQDREYVAHKNGWTEVEYSNLLLEPILKDTYGVFVYQEQIMEATRSLAGFSHGDADKVRKAMGRKDRSILAELEESFIEGCKKLGTLDEDTSRILWSQMAKFGEYGFNRSHAVSYAIIAYWTAWLKVYYPTEFMAATLTTEYRGSGKDKEQKVLETVQECKRIGIKLLSPDINKSDVFFTVPKENTIRFGLVGIKGVGASAFETIIENKPYSGLKDFLDRIEKRKCNKKIVSSLILSGAFDFENPDRLEQFHYLFDLRGETPGVDIYVNRSTRPEVPKNYTIKTKLDWEKIFLGAYVSGHPLDELNLPSWKDRLPNSDVTVAGIVNSVRKTTVKKGSMAGEEMAIASIETSEGDLKVVIFPRVWKKTSKKVESGKIIKVDGKIQERDIIANNITNPRVRALNDLVIT